MPDGSIVACPECKKKFKPKSDVSGKKIQCPFCREPFVVPAAKEKSSGKSASAGAKETAAGKQAAATAAASAPANDDYDESPDPYGVKTIKIVPRCPNCTAKMGEHDIICLKCGYNTVTRVWGKTEKTLGITPGQHFVYLLPALGSTLFAFVSVIGLLIYYVMVPSWVADTWMEFVDSEAIRMWTTVMFLFLLWMAGVFGYQYFIVKPKPDEILLEETNV